MESNLNGGAAPLKGKKCGRFKWHVHCCACLISENAYAFAKNSTIQHHNHIHFHFDSAKPNNSVHSAQNQLLKQT